MALRPTSRFRGRAGHCRSPAGFDLIYAFSVFTHLSEKTAHIVLSTLRDHIADTGVLVLTIRPKEVLASAPQPWRDGCRDDQEARRNGVRLHPAQPAPDRRRHHVRRHVHIPWLLRRAFPAVEARAGQLQPYR